jgi:acetyltransferase-like isoleucine patch superfamily enzyme
MQKGLEMANEVKKGALIHDSAILYGKNIIGEDCIILEKAILGYPTTEILIKMREKKKFAEEFDFPGCHLGHDVIIRSEGIIYSNVIIGNYSRTGHKVLIREDSVIGDNVLIGTNVVIDKNVKIGHNVSIQSTVYIPTNTIIEDYVFLGPNCVFLNDKFPIRMETELKGPRICRGATVGGNATIFPGVTVGEGAFVAAGALVLEDVPAWYLAKGVPAKFVELPKKLKVMNKII